MDSFNVPKKVNRHVLSALKFISRNKPFGYVIKTSDIIARVRHQMKSLIPVQDLPNVILKSLHNMENLRIVSKVGDNYMYCDPKQAAMMPIFPIRADVSNQNGIVHENQDIRPGRNMDSNNANGNVESKNKKLCGHAVTKQLEVEKPQQLSSASVEVLVLPDERERGDFNVSGSIDARGDDNIKSLESSNGENELKRKRNNRRKKNTAKNGRPKNQKTIKSEQNLHDEATTLPTSDGEKVLNRKRNNKRKKGPKNDRKNQKKIKLEHNIHDEAITLPSSNELEKISDDIKCVESSHCFEEVPFTSFHNADEKNDLNMLVTEGFADDLKPLTSSQVMEQIPFPSSDIIDKQMSFQKESPTDQTNYKALNLDSKLLSANQSEYTDKNSKLVKVYHLKLRAVEKVEIETDKHECPSSLLVHDSSKIESTPSVTSDAPNAPLIVNNASKIESTPSVASDVPNVLQRNLSTAEFAAAITALKEALVNDYETRHEEK